MNIHILKYSVLFLSACLLLTVIGATYASKHTQKNPVHLETMSPDEQSVYWKERIREDGGSRTYKEFVVAVNNFSSTQKHEAAHIFGDALYEIVGVNGISICDGKFSYGCFHALMASGIEEQGIGAAQTFHTACIEKLGETAEQCQHGIGHGILGTQGYGHADIEASLKVCESLTPASSDIGGCAGGVFMEYALRSIQGDGYRPWDSKHFLEPCASLSNPRYHASCAYWLPMWWMVADPEHSEVETMATKMGQWCTLMPGGNHAYTMCIAGITNRMQLLTNENPLRVAHICDLVTPNPELQFFCQQMSARRYTIYYSLEESLRACEGMDESSVRECRTIATSATEKRRADQTAHEAPALGDILHFSD